MATFGESRYFADLERQQRELERHEFNAPLSDDDLVGWCMRLDDGLNALASSLGLTIETDVRGRVIVVPKRGSCYGRSR